MNTEAVGLASRVVSPYQRASAAVTAPGSEPTVASDRVELGASTAVRPRHRLASKVLLGVACGLSVAYTMLPGATCGAAQTVSSQAFSKVTPATTQVDDNAGLQQLYALTHAAQPATDKQLAALEAAFPDNSTAALARLQRARLKLQSGHYSEAASMLDSNLVVERSGLADYALYLRAQALQKSGQLAPAQTVSATLQARYPGFHPPHGDLHSLSQTMASEHGGTPSVAQTCFDNAWKAHSKRNYQESSRLFTEYLARYGTTSHDNRGRAGYWAARDSERAGDPSTARVLYDALLTRYDATWYGFLSTARLRDMGVGPRVDVKPDSVLGQAVASLQDVTVAPDRAGAVELERVARAHQLMLIGADDWAAGELGSAGRNAPNDPRVNLGMAELLQSRGDNVEAVKILKRSYPDFAEMKPQEMPRGAWSIFYPMEYWDAITREADANKLDPYQVAGLIRQESVFNAHAKSSAKAYGLMQLLVPTAATVASNEHLHGRITPTALFNPDLNIKLGTGYLRDLMEKFGNLEYVAAAYNAGPGREEHWHATLPKDLDEWEESIPFSETRDYVQGVVRNTLQYDRLYDAQGNFRSTVGGLPEPR